MNRLVRRAVLAVILVLAACTGPSDTVPPPAAGWAGSTSSPIAVSPDGRTVWVVNPDADSVTPIDAVTLLAGEPVQVGREPWGVAVTPAGTVVVLNRLEGSVTVLDSGRRTDVPVGPEPGGLALTADGLHAWVSVSSQDEVVLLDLTEVQVTRRLPVGRQPWAVAVTPDGTAIVAHRFARARSGSGPDDSSEGWLSVLSADNVREIVLSPHDFGFPNVVESLVLADDRLWLTHLLNSPALPNDFQTTVSGGLSAVSLSMLEELPEMQLNLNDPAFSTPTNFPRAIAAHGIHLYVVLAGTNAVMAVDVSLPESPQLLGFWPAGSNPRGIVISPDGLRAYVMNYLSRDVSVLDISSPGSLLTHVELARVPVAPETLAPEMLHGKLLFNQASNPRMSRNGWMSCASCHPDGRPDGTTWDLGEGPRQTMPLWNLAGTEPLHAAATRDELQDFEIDIENLLGGTGLAPGPPNPLLGPPNAGTSAALDALAEFVMNGIRVPAAPRVDAAAAARGRQVFTQQGCTACHAGEAWTMSRNPGPPGSLDAGDTGVVTGVLLDVGTFNASADLTGALGFDVPTLLGLHASAPYFHDGHAADLHDLLAHERHSGAVLSSRDMDDLVQFLLSLDSDVPVFME